MKIRRCLTNLFPKGFGNFGVQITASSTLQHLFLVRVTEQIHLGTVTGRRESDTYEGHDWPAGTFTTVLCRSTGSDEVLAGSCATNV